MSALLDLAARCEAATGPDREMDACIAEAIGAVGEDYQRAKVHGEERPYFWHKWERDGEIIPDRYTASLDAAMTLVPEGSFWTVGCDPDGIYSQVVESKWREAECFVGGGFQQAATPALALCAAALRARS